MVWFFLGGYHPMILVAAVMSDAEGPGILGRKVWH